VDVNRTVTWWLLAGLLVVFDVVTVALHLFDPLWQAVLLGASAVLLGGFGALRWLDWRMHRAHSRGAFDDLARVRRERGGANDLGYKLDL
jgi:hypothetical protein